MKKLELNIGLHSKTLGKLNPIQIINALTGRGFEVIAYRVAQSTCEDGNEPCLAVRVAIPQQVSIKRAAAHLQQLAIDYGQDCIAIAGFVGPHPYAQFLPQYWISPDNHSHKEEERGEKLPCKVQNSGDGRAEAKLELTRAEITLLENVANALYNNSEEYAPRFTVECISPALSPCQAMQEKHLAKARELKGEEIDGWESKGQFRAYLQGVLIPDLQDSGHEATAQDFNTCSHFLQREEERAENITKDIIAAMPEIYQDVLYHAAVKAYHARKSNPSQSFEIRP